jgi:O-antigen/teichoic acid export membrane protein
VARGGSALVSLVSLPLVIRYLGQERYGVWVTVTTVAGWLSIFDFGFGLGLKNQVAAACGRDDSVELSSAISTASLLTMLPVCIGLMLTLFLCPLVDWGGFLNVGGSVDPSELRLLVTVASTFVLVSMWTKLGFAIVQGQQRGDLANYFILAGGVSSLALTALAALQCASLPWLAAALVGPGAIAPLLLWLWIGFRDRRLLPGFSASRTLAKRILSSGLGFLVLQLAVVIVSQMDIFVITKTNGPAEATPYAVAVRVMGLSTLLTGTYLTALWPAYGEAASRGDWAWIRTTHVRTLKLVSTGTALLGVAFAVLAPFVIRAWAGPAARADWPLYAWIAASFTIRAWTDVHAIFLNGVDRLRPQAYSALVHGFVTLVLSILGARYWGPTGVAAAGFFGFLFVSAWWLPLAVRGVFQEVRSD